MSTTTEVEPKLESSLHKLSYVPAQLALAEVKGTLQVFVEIMQ